MSRWYSAKKGFLVGINYWPGSSGLRMWEDFDSKEIKEDLRRIESLGLDAIRFFLFTPYFIKDGKLNKEAFEKLSQFVSLLGSTKLFAIPTFFVGHMSGNNWEVDSWAGKNFFLDPDVRAEQREYIKEVIRVTRACPNVILWCISNELPIYKSGRDPVEVRDWVRNIYKLIKSIDYRPVTLGDGVWSSEIEGDSSDHLTAAENFRLREIKDFQDILGLHFYPRTPNWWLHAYTPSFRIAMARFWKDDVFVEEFGNSVTMSSEENQRKYYNEVLFSAMANGAKGALSWCWSDFDLKSLRPYLHNTFEMRFGLKRLDGSLRPAIKSFDMFKRICQDLFTEGFHLEEGNQWLVIPSSYYKRFAFDWDGEKFSYYNFYLNFFGLLKSAGVNPAIVYEPAPEFDQLSFENVFSHQLKMDVSSDFIWFPRLKRVTAPFWEYLLGKVETGARIYASYSVDHWVADLDRLLGIESDLKFGFPEYFARGNVCIKSEKTWGLFSTGEEILIENSFNDRTRESGFFKVNSVKGSKILLSVGEHPLLLKKEFGEGSTYFSLFPLEYLDFANQSQSFRRFLVRLYVSILVDSGVGRLYCLEPGIEISSWFCSEKGRRYLFFNHTWSDKVFRLLIRSSDGLFFVDVFVKAKEPKVVEEKVLLKKAINNNGGVL